MSEADREFLSDEEMGPFFAEDAWPSFRHGLGGPADDVIILYEGFMLGQGGEQTVLEPSAHHSA